MSCPAQRGFHTTDDNGHSRKSLPYQSCIDYGCAVGTRTVFISRRIGIVMAEFAERRIMGQHGILCASGNANKKPGTSQTGNILGGVPAWLCDNADPVPSVGQKASQQRSPKRRMVHIGIACNQQDVHCVPAEVVHFPGCHGQKRGGEDIF
jgi:hypothetical protein